MLAKWEQGNVTLTWTSRTLQYFDALFIYFRRPVGILRSITCKLPVDRAFIPLSMGKEPPDPTNCECNYLVPRGVWQVREAGNISLSWPLKVPMKFVTGPHGQKQCNWRKSVLPVRYFKIKRAVKRQNFAYRFTQALLFCISLKKNQYIDLYLD